MTPEKIISYFASVAEVELPEISGFDRQRFLAGVSNVDGIEILDASFDFRAQMMSTFVKIQSSVARERLYVGTLIQNLPESLIECLGPIYLAQFYSFFKLQPKGESGHLINSGWWNNARIREAPGLVATSRFADPERVKKGRFTLDPLPKRRGWAYDVLPYRDMKAYQQGRLVIFSDPAVG